MHYEYRDFNSAAELFAGDGEAKRWQELVDVLDSLTPQLQPSDQQGRQGTPIFDPKATNTFLTSCASARGWHKVPVPASLRAFGVNWDAGKASVLAEWQFSNYPFLWNNIIRTEAVYKSELRLPAMQRVTALVVVTKSGVLPASNSTLYYEQACAQLDAVTRLGAFDIPIRLVGLTIQPGAATVQAAWNTYPGRYSREAGGTAIRQFDVRWTAKSRARLALDELTPPPE